MNPEQISQLPQLELARQLTQIPVPVEEFLDLVPEFRAKYEAVVAKFQLDIDLPILIDPSLPANVGGAYIEYGNVRRLHLNPMHVLGSEIELARIFVHEGIHAGIVRHPLMMGVTTKIMEESLTDALTMEMIEDVYKQKAAPSGYQHLVEELRSFMPGKSFAKLAMLINEQGDERTLELLVEQVVLEELLQKQPPALGEQQIREQLESKWEALKRLFPRIMNKVYAPGTDLHAEAQMESQRYQIDHLLKRARQMILKNDQLMHEILSQAVQGLNPRTPEGIHERLLEMGYGYAWVENPLFWQMAAELYCKNDFDPVERKEDLTAMPERETVES